MRTTYPDACVGVVDWSFYEENYRIGVRRVCFACIVRTKENCCRDGKDNRHRSKQYGSDTQRQARPNRADRASASEHIRADR